MRLLRPFFGSVGESRHGRDPNQIRRIARRLVDINQYKCQTGGLSANAPCAAAGSVFRVGRGEVTRAEPLLNQTNQPVSGRGQSPQKMVKRADGKRTVRGR